MSDPIDTWIAEHGLDAQIDQLIRTCGYDRVLAAMQGAPARFAERAERIVGYRQPQGRGAPVTRDAMFYEVLLNAVDGVKRRYSLDDKQACTRLADDLAALKRALTSKGSLDQLSLLGLDRLAGLDSKTIHREYKRCKPHIRTVSDAAAEIETNVKRRRSGMKIKAKSNSVLGRPPHSDEGQ